MSPAAHGRRATQLMLLEMVRDLWTGGVSRLVQRLVQDAIDEVRREGVRAARSSCLSNGRTEGLNGKARTITRRSFGFRDATYGLIALLRLCCSGIHFEPLFHCPGARRWQPETTH